MITPSIVLKLFNKIVGKCQDMAVTVKYWKHWNEESCLLSYKFLVICMRFFEWMAWIAFKTVRKKLGTDLISCAYIPNCSIL